jgi:hypothetical protein
VVEQKLDALSTNVKKAIVDSPDQVLEENDIVFPVKTLEDLEKVEELCKNSKINLAIKKEFMAYKPKLTHVKWAKVGLSQIIGDELLQQFNWNGVQGKPGLKNLKLFSKTCFSKSLCSILFTTIFII